jgi:hypothetical protein
MAQTPVDPSRPAPEVRNLRFTLGDVPRYWLGGRRGVSIFFNGLSIFFPEGERFFVRSVKRFRDRIEDPVLQRDVAAFTAQEGIHGREHERYNEVVRAQGYPVAELERRVAELLTFGRGLFGPRMQLGITCALEHYTAALGEGVLRDERVLEGAHPAMAALWRWHATEELEHKSVAFDVFLAAGGTYAERVATMVIASAFFWAKVVQHQTRMMHADGLALSASEWRALLHFLFVDPGGLPDIGRAALDYLRPDFHPSDRDDRELLSRWRSGLAAGGAA